MVVHLGGARWRHLHPTITSLITQMEAGVRGAAITPTWTAERAREAAHLTGQLRSDWEQRLLDAQHLTQLELVSGALDVTACTLLRAQLEAARHCLATCLSEMVTELTDSGRSVNLLTT